MSRVKKDIEEVFNLLGKDWIKLRDSNILISGGTGFFGKAIVSSLIHANYLKNLNIKIFIITRNKKLNEFSYTIKDQLETIKYINTDIKDFENKELDIHYIIHAAANSNSEFVINNPISTLNTIIIGTKKIIEFSLTQKNLKSFLFVSSGAVNSANKNQKRPILEDDIYPIDNNNKFSSYSIGKKTAEKYLAECHKKYNLPVKILRGFTFIGPQINLKHKLALTYIFNCFLNNQDINVLNPECRRSFMYTTDLVFWILKVMINAKNGSIYNLGSNEEVTISEFAKKILKYNNSIKLIESKSITNDYYVPDIKKIKKDLDLEITVSLDESIKRLVEFYKE